MAIPNCFNFASPSFLVVGGGSVHLGRPAVLCLVRRHCFFIFSRAARWRRAGVARPDLVEVTEPGANLRSLQFQIHADGTGA
jgi:hypothetical protein